MPKIQKVRFSKSDRRPRKEGKRLARVLSEEEVRIARSNA